MFKRKWIELLEPILLKLRVKFAGSPFTSLGFLISIQQHWTIQLNCIQADRSLQAADEETRFKLVLSYEQYIIFCTSAVWSFTAISFLYRMPPALAFIYFYLLENEWSYFFLVCFYFEELLKGKFIQKKKLQEYERKLSFICLRR